MPLSRGRCGSGGAPTRRDVQASGVPGDGVEADEHPDAPRREITYALLALAGLLIGISRVADETPPSPWLQALDAGIGLAFLLDWLRRIREARRPGRYALRNSYEVLTFIPFTLLPGEAAAGDVLRGARLVRLARFLRYGRFAKVGLGLARLPRRARYLQRIVRDAQLLNISLLGLFTVALGAVALLLLEREALSGRGYEAALWWSLSLFTTVGYAIPDPVTSAGYFVTGILMVAGATFLGVFTASLAGAILRTPSDVDE